MRFFQNLNFSSSNEDGVSELAALAGSRRILCLTGSGTRPLDMLLSGADEVIALDINPVQNALLALKVAAIETLDYDEFLAFLGVAQSPARAALYQKLRPRLSAEMQALWDSKGKALARGIWYEGKWEKLLRWNARMLKLLHGRAVTNLLNAPSIGAQSEIWRKHFERGLLRRTVEMLGRQWVWKWVMREPAGDFLPHPGAVADKLAECFRRASERFLFRTGDFACLMLLGHMVPGGAVPVHLEAENYERLRQSLPRLRLVTGGLADLKALGLSGIDGFSVSDFGSYCGPEFYRTCWENIIAVAAPQARFCERIFMNDMALPFASLREDVGLSQRLTEQDRAIIYAIRAGELTGASV